MILAKMAPLWTVASAFIPILSLAYLLIGSTLTLGHEREINNITIRMPDIRPDYKDQYLCMAHRVPANREGHYLIGIDPKGDSSRVHHMLIYACQMPGLYQRDSPYFVWDCGAMHMSPSSGQGEPSFEQGPVCMGGNEQLMYGWAMDAPALEMPEHVGFKIGGDTKLNFLVLQVHYGHYEQFSRLPDLTDNSGLNLVTTPGGSESDITKRAGLLLLLSYGYVEQGSSRHEIWCQIEEDIDIHPFRFRVHTHKLGTKVMGAKINGSKQKYPSWITSANDHHVTIGIGNPQLPQMFYEVREPNMTISRGDSVYAYCEFNNHKSHAVNIGQTGNDEMCNFYLMYWTDSPKLLDKHTCSQRNPTLARSLYKLLQ